MFTTPKSFKLVLLLACLVGHGCNDPEVPKPVEQEPEDEEPSSGCIGARFDDVAYAKDKRTRLDVFLPEKPRQKPIPWVMWVHGGGWAGGSKDSVETFAIRQTCRGYAVVAVDYRLSFEARFPAGLADLRASLRYMKAHATEFNLDASNVVLWGASAGGHLATLMALSANEKTFDRADDTYRKFPVSVRGVIGWWTPTSFSDFDNDFGDTCPQRTCHTCVGSPESRFLGCEVKKCAQRALRASPVHWVHAKAPPILLAHGTDDCTVPAAQSTRLAEALKKVGANVQLQLVPGARHGDGSWLRPDVLAPLDAFIDTHLQAHTLSGLPADRAASPQPTIAPLRLPSEPQPPQNLQNLLR